MKTLNRPSFTKEKMLWQQGFKFVAGIDEVGRGAFAGPIIAAAVILPENFSLLAQINDSKLLSSQKRKKLSEVIKCEATYYVLETVPISYINKFGIGKANNLVLRKAAQKLILSIGSVNLYLLVDGFRINNLPGINQLPLIKGDRISASIAAASIIAKVYRDEMMVNLPEKYHKYELSDNKGYGTKAHQAAISKYGLSDIHRTSFNLQMFINLS